MIKMQNFWLFSFSGLLWLKVRKILCEISLWMATWLAPIPPESNEESGNSGSNVDALVEMMADVGIANHMVAWKISWRMSIYTRLPYSRSWELSKPGSQLEFLITSPDVPKSNKTKHSPREYSPKAHYRFVFKERGQSLHFVESGIFNMWTWLTHLLTTILVTRCQNCIDSWQKLEPCRYDGNELPLSFHH